MPLRMSTKDLRCCAGSILKSVSVTPLRPVVTTPGEIIVAGVRCCLNADAPRRYGRRCQQASGFKSAAVVVDAQVGRGVVLLLCSRPKQSLIAARMGFCCPVLVAFFTLFFSF